ncbi:putative DNA-directed RNA polymerase III, beta subunit [Viridothelium virens]|uniref:DNA-directed RNA polymerase subunit beta n=1 Tax=Viridothelium virens TaxID=1048519 RepID=A0A6A6GXT7_VIRVR|nr:putative DNA-directed RNA polymerase III, beta subunit [Viridothelium virens]
MAPKRKKQGPTEVALTATETPQVTSRIPSKKAVTRGKDPTESRSTDQTQGSHAIHATRKAASRQKTSQTEDDEDAWLKPFYYGKSVNDPINTATDKWNLLPAFLKVKGLVKQHIESFNYFVETELQKIIDVNREIRSDVDHKFFLRYEAIRVLNPCRTEDDHEYVLNVNTFQSHPPFTPNECRLRDMTYAAPIVVDILYKRGRDTIRKRDVCIGRIPIMLRSSKCVLAGRPAREMGALGECSIDPGGYFVVRGQEKVILVQEQLSKNRILVESVKGIVQASVTSSTHERKSKSYVLLKKGRIYLRHNTFNEDIPIVIILRAMGVQSDREMQTLIAGDVMAYQDAFAINFEESVKSGVLTQQQALDFIGSRLKIVRKPGQPYRRNYQQEALESLSSVIVTHVPVHDLNFRPKAIYIAFMVRRVVMAMQDPSLIDDRDYVGNKRLELAGQMLALLFEDLFKRFNNDFKSTIDKVLRKPNRTSEFDALQHIHVHLSTITGGMERAIATGNWNVTRFKMHRAGVSHLLSRFSYIAALGMMTRIQSQFEKTRKVSGPRALQPSQFGMLCPSDTPEGESCGLVKNLALMTHITTENDEAPVKELVFMLGAEEITSITGTEIYNEGAYIIFINGTPVAITRHPKKFLDGFRRFRRMGRVSEFISIYINHHYHSVHISTDEGRVCRPLIVVEKARSKVNTRFLQYLQRGSLDFDDFLNKGLVEYLDVNEENDSNIAIHENGEYGINEATTHLEIEPFTILGAVAGLIPYPHHNQSPRNTYQCAMGKQAMGAVAYNQFTRIDTLLYLMVYPQKPMVKTRSIELVKYDKLPAGQNSVVAVMSYSGYDIEDALVLNKASCDRGFGRCQVMRKVSVPLKKYANGGRDRIGDRDPEDPKHKKLGIDGLVEVGMKVEDRDVMILKQQPNNTSGTGVGSDAGRDEGWKSAPISYRLPDPCYVDKVVATANEGETDILKILTRQTRRPEVGDKFSSRHGQKGVVGIIAEEADMPFDDKGIRPDIIMNPHGFPSRMTVGKMLELLSGKAGVLNGSFEYGTAFGGSDAMDMGNLLLKYGYSYSGKDFLTSGITGEALECYVFMGPTYYQKLKHMVQDKMHARPKGPRAILTRQPTEGRSRDGGLRLGEMERDCLIAYGASQLLLERLMLSSDVHVVDICEACGMMGYGGWCQMCRKSDNVVKVRMPYAAKLLLQELLSMNVKAALQLEDEFPADTGLT